MHGYYDAGVGRRGGVVVEKRGFFVPTAEKEEVGEGFEVQVFRARGRRRVEAGYERAEGEQGGVE